jgi:hypothetical protein
MTLSTEQEELCEMLEKDETAPAAPQRSSANKPMRSTTSGIG